MKATESQRPSTLNLEKFFCGISPSLSLSPIYFNIKTLFVGSLTRQMEMKVAEITYFNLETVFFFFFGIIHGH
jgi:hypothetical protein